MYLWLYCNYAISNYHHQGCEFESSSWWSVLDTTLCDKVCQWLATGRWLTLVSSTNKIEILLQVVLNSKTTPQVVMATYLYNNAKTKTNSGHRKMQVYPNLYVWICINIYIFCKMQPPLNTFLCWVHYLDPRGKIKLPFCTYGPTHSQVHSHVWEPNQFFSLSTNTKKYLLVRKAVKRLHIRFSYFITIWSYFLFLFLLWITFMYIVVHAQLTQDVSHSNLRV
jgi:hypothetical protein